MNRTLNIGIWITLLLVGGLLTFFYFYKIKEKPVDLFGAVPNTAVVVLETKNISSSFQKFAKQAFWKNLSEADVLGTLTARVMLVDSLLSLNGKFNRWKQNSHSLLSVHPYSNGAISVLLAVETDEEIDVDIFSVWLEEYFPNRYKMIKRKFDEQLICDFVDFKGSRNFSIASRERIFLFSFDGLLIEEALFKLKRKIVNPTPGLKEMSFLKNLGGDANLYINYRNMPVFLACFAKPECSSIFDFLNFNANWSGLKLETEDERIALKGLTVTDDSIFQFLDVFGGQNPLENAVKNLLPANTAFALRLAFSNKERLQQNLHEYLQAKQKDATYRKFMDSVEALFNFDMEQKFATEMADEACLAQLHIPGLTPDSSTVAIVKFNNVSTINTLLDSYVSAYRQKFGADSTDSAATNFRQLYFGNFLKFFLGDAFENVQADYCYSTGNYLVFANNKSVLQNFYEQQQSNRLLVRDEGFIKHQTKLDKLCNVEFLLCSKQAMLNINDFVSPTFLTSLNTYKGFYKKGEYLSFQYGFTGNKSFATNACLTFNNTENTRTELVWDINLDTTLATKPAVVFNSSVNENIILAQDANGNFYGINKEGKIIFKSKIPAPIISKIFTVDLYNNGKTAYLFNTAHQVYLLNDKGENVQNYPIWIPAGTDMSLSLFDFYGDKSYTYFIAGKFYKLWAYNTQARLQAGWNPKNFWPNAIQPLAGFTLAKSHLLYTVNEKGKLSFFDLQAKPFAQLAGDSLGKYKFVSHSWVDTSHVRFYLVDTANVMSVQDVFSSKATTAKKQAIQPGNNFSLATISSAGNEYYVSKTNSFVTVYDSSFAKLFAVTILDSVLLKTELIYLNNGLNLAYVDRQKGEIQIIDRNNKPYKSFPQKGSTDFCFGNLYQDSDNYLGDWRCK